MFFLQLNWPQNKQKNKNHLLRKIKQKKNKFTTHLDQLKIKQRKNKQKKTQLTFHYIAHEKGQKIQTSQVLSVKLQENFHNLQLEAKCVLYSSKQKPFNFV